MNKILHIISSLNVGGAEMMLYRLLKESTNRLNDRHIVISLLPKGELKSKYQAEGIEVFMLDIRHKPLSTCKEIISIIKKTQPMTIQTWMYHADLIGGLLARLIGFKNIFWGVRNTHVPKGSHSTFVLMKLLALFSSFVPKKIVCVADSAKISHIDRGYSDKKMLTISNGYDFSLLNFSEESSQEIRTEFNISSQTLIIGCLGRFHDDKGQDLFVEAVARLPHNKFKFMLVGKNCDWNNTELVKLIEQYNLRDSFILTGQRSDTVKCLSAFDIFCMPSRTEGFPNSLAEAMAMELPCVGFNVGDSIKLSCEGVTLIKPKDVEGLSVKLKELTSYTNSQRSELGKKAAIKVKTNFSIQNIYEKYLFIYDNH